MAGPDNVKMLILIPTYNEGANISSLLERLLRYPEAHILVIDDNSPDGTAAHVERYTESGRIRLLNREKKDGRGGAVLDGLRLALAGAEGFDIVVEMDADFSHDPEDLNHLLARSCDFDVVVGSRYQPGSKIIGWPLSRRLFSKAANLFARLWLGVPLKDLTNGYRCYNIAAARSLARLDLKSKGYIALSEIAFRLYRQGFSFGEVPTRFVNRERGKSNFSLHEVIAAFTGVIRIRFSGPS